MNMNRKPAFLSALGLVSALGTGAAQSSETLFRGRPADMRVHGDYLVGERTVLGTVTGKLDPLSDRLGHHDTRNNRLLWTAANQIADEISDVIGTFGKDRVAVILGTSTSGIEEGTSGYRDRLTSGHWPYTFRYADQEIGSPAEFLRDALGLQNQAYVISTACSSSAKSFAAAQRLMQTGLCDAVLVGGVDSLCRLTVRGFHSLSSVANGICNPLSVNRDGINIGEGAALFVMRPDRGEIALMGVGETSDAHHPNAPHPDGIGAIAAMRAALEQSGLPTDAISYVNLHGTATPLNDSMEAHAVDTVFDHHVAVSSTKPMTGHTLGAAGAIEAAILWLSLKEIHHGAPLPRHIWDGVTDPDIPDINLDDRSSSCTNGSSCDDE